MYIIYISRRRGRERDRRAREIVEERESRLSKRRARDRKRANEHRTSDTSAQSDVRLGKRRLQQRDAYASFSVERRHARIKSVWMPGVNGLPLSHRRKETPVFNINGNVMARLVVSIQAILDPLQGN